ncbi:MAG TPA: hypothetical protein DCZ69_13040 [Syntrophobacteraceae bacterium]|nr:hypothetical protein [Syntrophobacteraceae bacterium]
MKKTLKIVAGIAVFIILVVILVFYLTSNMVDTANSFFKAIKQNDLTKAQTYLAEEFKAATDEKALKGFLATSALANFRETSWGERQVSAGGRGELSGSVTTESGSTIPIKMTLVKERGEWKIYSLRRPEAGLTTKDESVTPQPPSAGVATKQEPATSQKSPLVLTAKEASRSMPGKPEQIALAKRSMHDFGVSLKAKSMEHFRNSVSNLWQQQFSTEKLNEAYGKVIEAELDLSALDTIDPILDEEPKIDKDGVLTLKGHYQTHPKQVYFQEKFINEGGAWKLLGFHFRFE